jgi:hypothetical protein
MTPLATFLWGFAGSLAVEVVALNGYADRSRLPKRYKTVSFWIARVLLAVVAGGLAVAYGIQTPILAANVGISAPLIIGAIAANAQPPTEVLPDPPAT